MNKNTPKTPIPYQGGVFYNVASYLKLVLRLMGDRRVSPFLKLLPIGALAYLISPLDAFIPVVDDAAVVWMGLYLFVELSPPEVVEEHRRAIYNVISGQAHDVTEDEEIVEGEFREEK